MPLDYQVHISRHPYPDTIPEAEFRALLEDAVRVRATDIDARHQAGEYQRDKMAFVVLDPTLSASTPADDIVLALVLIGDGADFFAPNAMAKAFALREHGVEASALVVTHNHRLPDGSFRFGGAVEVAGTIIGGSGQTELQDRYQCTLFAADFNHAVAKARQGWEAVHGPGRWYLDDQSPHTRVHRIVERILGTPGA